VLHVFHEDLPSIFDDLVERVDEQLVADLIKTTTLLQEKVPALGVIRP